MKEAPLHPREIERQEVLDDLEILDSGAEQCFDELTDLASRICGTSISLISLIDSDRQWFKSRIGLDPEETSRDIAFYSHAILGNDLLEVPDTSKDERFHDNPLVVDSPNITFYAGIPLIINDLPIGTLCVIDEAPKHLTEDQKHALKILGKQVESQLELRRRNLWLERFNSERDKYFHGHRP